jgi:surfactin synthase thioesterase subunit
VSSAAALRERVDAAASAGPSTAGGRARQRAGDPTLLYCLAYAGGAATVFRPWRECAPAEVRVCPVERPGRGTRVRESLIGDYAALADRLTLEIRADLERRARERGDVRFALFGHSAGARFAFGVAARMFGGDGPRPVHCFIAAASPPHRVVQDRQRGRMNDDELAAELRLFGGTSADVLAEPALLRHALPILRADLRASEGSHVDRERRIACPLTAFAATRDHLVHPDSVSEWGRYTRSMFRASLLEGDHFSLLRSPGAILGHLSTTLRAGGPSPA